MEHTTGKPMNPLVIGVSVSVLVVSLVGIGAITGLIPLAKSQKPLDAKAPGEESVDAAVEATRQASRPERAAATQLCATCGTVESVRPFEVKGEAGGAGAAAGGAAAGPEIRKQVNSKTVHRVTIRMDDGSYRTISQPVAPGYGVGEKVRIIDGSVVPHG